MYCWWGYLHVNKAIYGRQSSNKCSVRSSVRVAFDVTTSLQRICHGKKDCNPYHYMNQIFSRVDPYDGTEWNLYFTADFDCKGKEMIFPYYYLDLNSFDQT